MHTFEITAYVVDEDGNSNDETFTKEADDITDACSMVAEELDDRMVDAYLIKHAEMV